MATHHHTGRPGTAVVILSDLVFGFFWVFFFSRQADDLSAWSQEVERDTLSGQGGGGWKKKIFLLSVKSLCLLE